ncbi:hypothetical protein BOTBODRAFT_265475 [Botryobasidium botryosum FD-172 SS1]|uniref:Transmembrane protein n=1 Tax=Botryobasidium botryosum (strain FD-172 SS1) TaxID=930990 RepID=A0A067MWS3_BOTB1|nr:hypothetical protein BOTBODRAFT_265475 [Botryobasidium botryosum FD-172 SS1]
MSLAQPLISYRSLGVCCVLKPLAAVLQVPSTWSLVPFPRPLSSSSFLVLSSYRLSLSPARLFSRPRIQISLLSADYAFSRPLFPTYSPLRVIALPPPWSLEHQYGDSLSLLLVVFLHPLSIFCFVLFFISGTPPPAVSLRFSIYPPPEPTSVHFPCLPFFSKQTKHLPTLGRVST